jgi:hypothetical protein
VGGWVQLGPLGTTATNRPIVPASGDYDGEIGEMIGKGDRSTREKTCPNAALFTKNPTCCKDANPGRHGGWPATNLLSYGTAYAKYLNRVRDILLKYQSFALAIFIKYFFLVKRCNMLS